MVPGWVKIRETLGRDRCGTLQIDGLAPDAVIRVENAHQNGQIRNNAKLLGICQIILVLPGGPFLRRVNPDAFEISFRHRRKQIFPRHQVLVF